VSGYSGEDKGFFCFVHLLNVGYQRKIFGKEESDDITVGRQARFHLPKQGVLLSVTSHAERPVTVLASKTGRIIPLYRSLSPFDNQAVMADPTFTCRHVEFQVMPRNSLQLLFKPSG
jgi:hypothetical protein